MQLNYKLQGEGAPIVILHGLFGMLDNWQTVARNLSTDYAVYTVDARNHGRSEHAEHMNYQVMAEDMANFLEQHGIVDPCLIGHSMGGKAMMQLALEYPILFAAGNRFLHDLFAVSAAGVVE